MTREEKNAYDRQRKAGYREQGRCSVCGGERMPGHSRCRMCVSMSRLDYMNRRDKRISEGLCVRCAKVNPEPDRNYCPECMTRAKAQNKAYREKMKKSGGQ